MAFSGGCRTQKEESARYDQTRSCGQPSELFDRPPTKPLLDGKVRIRRLSHRLTERARKNKDSAGKLASVDARAAQEGFNPQSQIASIHISYIFKWMNRLAWPVWHAVVQIEFVSGCAWGFSSPTIRPLTKEVPRREGNGRIAKSLY